MKNVYIVLTQSGTYFSKFIKLITHKPYNHASIALDKSLDCFYSFGRLKPRNPFIAGFVTERKNAGVFELFKKSPSVVIELEVSNEQYEIIQNTISNFLENKSLYKYDLLNLFLFSSKHHINRKNRFFCSQFVAFVLNSAGIKTLKSPEHTQAIDFLDMKNSRIVYRGNIQDYST